MRNTTKFKRSIKAISPVIATLLMIAIAVVASLVVYAWVTGYIGGTTSTAGKAIQIQSFASQGGNLVIYVQNVGQGDVELNRDQSVYVDSNLIPLRSTVTPKIPIVAGQTVALLTDLPYTAGTKVSIKVTTTDGTFMTITGTGGSSSNPSVLLLQLQFQLLLLLQLHVTPTALLLLQLPVPTATPTPTPVPTATPTPTPVPTATPTPTPTPNPTLQSDGFETTGSAWDDKWDGNGGTAWDQSSLGPIVVHILLGRMKTMMEI